MKFQLIILLAVAAIVVSGHRVSKDDCRLPVNSGICRAMIRRYYWNFQTNSCQMFTYGGCGGNRNNFRSSQECAQECGRYFRRLVNVG
ncbi:unnamed protein product [Allacma fusca]|uniref:BPTI/Kunitz inhibitor domain-containing protein n=1 Tax=Allacma fusca TaxID=39272 RepID=A0A8J2NVM0_9HEXA|nr:unnamed protein product [Allacma fusca]